MPNFRLENALEGGIGGAGAGALIGAAILPGIGTAIGAAGGAQLGALLGLLSDTEMQELSHRYAMGEVSPEQEKLIGDALADRFEQLRKDQGSDLSRRGLSGSSIASELYGKSLANERESLADAMAQQSYANQGLGFQMQSDLNAQRANTDWRRNQSCYDGPGTV